MRIKNISAHRFFLMPWIVFLLCFTVFSYVVAQENLPAIVKKIQPSVVVILTYDKEGKALAQGSGFFISKRGNAITNICVLQGAASAQVKTADGKVYKITKILAEDKECDIVLFSVDIPRNKVHFLSLGTGIPKLGERILVIGNPLGLEQSVSRLRKDILPGGVSDGIVSAVRNIPSFGKIILISDTISPRSSGSPVVNMKGEVIGVFSFRIVEGQDMYFAIPSERVTKLIPGKGKPLVAWDNDGKEQYTPTEELYSNGLVFLSAGDYENALSYFKEAVKKNPNYAEAYVKIGLCNDELGRFNEAIDAYKQAIQIKPDDAEAHCGLGGAYIKLRRFTEAIDAFSNRQ